MVDTTLVPNPECLACRGTGHVRKKYDCECLFQEAKTSLLKRAAQALFGDPRPKGHSMVTTARRDFMKLMGTGAVAAVLHKPAATLALPINIPKFSDIVIRRGDPEREHSLAWYSIYGTSTLLSTKVIIAETA